MSKVYPLKIEFGDDWCFSKGHHDPEVFIEEARKQAESCDPETNGSASMLWLDPKTAVQYVKRDWRRVTFDNTEEQGEYWYAPVDGPGRGCFPLTSLFYTDAGNAEVKKHKAAQLGVVLPLDEAVALVEVAGDIDNGDMFADDALRAIERIRAAQEGTR